MQVHSWANRKTDFLSWVCALAALWVGLMPATDASAGPAEKVLYTFDEGDGNYPVGPLIADRHGNLYGTTAFGGDTNVTDCTGGFQGCGVVFKLSPPAKAGGAWTETVLHVFSGGADGGEPGALIADTKGNLYGTTKLGGNTTEICTWTVDYPLYGCGVVFKLAPPAPGHTQWIATVLHKFTGGGDGGTPNDLIADSHGNLYGTTYQGGTGCGIGCGVVFKLSPPAKPGGPWVETVLHAFNDRDGAQPLAGLIADAKGNLYGTTEGGGAFGHGVVFKVTPSGAVTVLYSFTGGNDGGNPQAGLIADSKGNLYGTTYQGGTGCGVGCGIAFKLSPPAPGHTQWTETILHAFKGGNDGFFPQAGLVADRNGNLYGTTAVGGGGSFGNGTVFKLAQPAKAGGPWTETVLHAFTGNDGSLPQAGLLADSHGILYGTTSEGGGLANGVVFQLTGSGFVP